MQSGILRGTIIRGGIALLTIPSIARAQTVTVNVTATDIQQTIEGFGTSQGLAYAPSLYTWPEPQRSQIMDLAFSPSGGIGLTFFRSQVLPSLEPSPGVWDDTDTAQVWMMHEAVRRGPVKLVATVPTPPAWMKTDNCITGGKVLATHYQDYANFLAHYATQYATNNGVSIHALSLTNEPDSATPACDAAQGWSTNWNGSDIATFLHNNLSPTWAANDITTKVIAPESVSWGSVDSFLAATYADPVATARLDIVAGHQYLHSQPSLRIQSALDRGKPIWMTESSIEHPVWTMDGALAWAGAIHDSLTGGQVSAWIWWGLAYALADWDRDQFVIGLDFDANVYSVSKTFWALGNFSRFIRPGFVRVGASSSDSSLRVSAYKDPATGRVVIVAINPNASARNVQIHPSGFTAGVVTPYVTSDSQNLSPQLAVSLAGVVTVPARSIVTYVPAQPGVVWRGTDGSVNLWQLAGGALRNQLVTGTPDSGWTIQGIGDFNGDGASDLFWRCTGPSCYQTAHGQIAIWYGGGMYPGPSFPGVVDDDGWQVQAVGDFDGDGQSDILWRYFGASGHGQLSIWFSGQYAARPVALPGVVGDDGWKIQGLGDFDGDGKSDILWRYDGAVNHGQLAIWFGGQSSSPPAAFPGLITDDGWQIKGIGDFDGDGRSDILWRYLGPVDHGQLAVWWSGQSANPAPWYPAAVPDDNWMILGVQDFDGDRRSDILWRFTGATGHGQLAIWFGAQNANPVPAYPAVVSDNLVFQGTGKFD